MTSTRYTSPFTAVQWQELEHQVLVYKHLISGVPIPPELIYTVKRSLDSPFSRGLLFQQPIGTSSSSSSSSSWDGCFQMGFGRKADPEPWRCRRTDGKKWRCSKEAHTDSKYCEKHMHRGKNRSRKPVEPCSTSRTAKSPNISPSIQSSLNRNLSLNITNTTSAHSPSYPFLDTHNSSLTPKPFDTVFSPHEHQLLLDSGYDKDYSCFLWGTEFKPSSRQQPGPKVEGNDVSTEKPFHHFFGEWHPKDADSWL